MQPLSKAKLSQFRKFLQKKTREEEGRFLIEGWHLLDEALRAGRAIHALIIDESAPREPAESEILERAIRSAGEAFSATPEQVAQISDTRNGQGAVALLDRVGVDFEATLERLPKEGACRIVALDAVGDPGNCGAILRACAWFGIDAALLSQGTAELENGKTARATMGGLFHLPVATRVDLVEALPALVERGFSVVTTELAGAVSLEGFAFPERAVLVIGNEARGVSPEVSALAAAKVFIPKYGAGESLNAAAAAAVFLGNWRMRPGGA